ncbi:MAG: hypothetical protein MUF60_11080 [Vicinamibacterales bacterium]|nr:hypothetical protein [Vicinamibacterales bacterium]
MTDLHRRGAVAAARRLVLLATACASLVAAPGCAGRPAAPPLAHTLASPEDTARAVLDALAAGDGDRLRALALSEQEFRDHVWPRLPAARPERNLPLAYVWGDLRQKSDSHLAVALAETDGQPLSLVRLRFTGETTDYGTYRVHRKSLLTVRDRAGTETSCCRSSPPWRCSGWRCASTPAGSRASTRRTTATRRPR